MMNGYSPELIQTFKRQQREKHHERLMRVLLSERHGVPVAYVNRGQVEWVHQEGVYEIGEMFRRNTDARFAVLKEKVGYCLYDLSTAHLNNEHTQVAISDPEVFPTEEAAVMAAMLQA